MKPDYIQALIFGIPTLICGFFIYVMYSIGVNSIAAWGLIILGTLVFGYLFLDSFFDLGRYRTIEEINKYKAKLSYSDEHFVIHYSFSNDRVIKWETVEAIFFIDSPPRDGKYHTKEYRIILNDEPVEIMEKPLKWYDKILPNPMKEKYPLIRINNDTNADFKTFHLAIEIYLIQEEMSSDYLNKKFGNEVRRVRKDKNTIIIEPVRKPLKSMGFYNIFDRGNSIDDKRLIHYRNIAK